MKLSTLALIILWPVTVLLVLRAIATTHAAWRYSKNKSAQALNEINAMLNGKWTYYPWKARSLYACASLLLLAYFQGWLIIG